MAGKTDAELNQLLDQQKKKASQGTVVIVIGVLVGLLLCFISVIFGTIVGIVIAGIGIYKRSKAKDAIKEQMADAALLPALNEVFDNVTYETNSRIPDSVIRNTKLGFSFPIDKIQGNDYIKATYKGVSIEMSDITLIEVEVRYDEKGHRTETDRVRFKGLWLIADFHKQFSADLLLRERDGFLDHLNKGTIKTESESFNKQFIIQSKNDLDVFYILTPHMMEYIQEMDKKANGRTYMLFQKEGKLCLALDTGRDAFEIHSISKADAADLRRQFIEEVRYVTDLIDELKLVKTLHGEESDS